MREFFLAARTFVLAASDYECGGLVVLFLPGKEMIVGLLTPQGRQAFPSGRLPPGWLPPGWLALLSSSSSSRGALLIGSSIRLLRCSRLIELLGECLGTWTASRATITAKQPVAAQ